MAIKAKWIWRRQEDYHTYNQTILARKAFRLGADVREAKMIITADSFYRLCINGVWVNDGPCRSWPEHFQYDEIDAAAYLRKGDNMIEVVARYFGCGDFHRIPRQAGLLVQLEAKLAGGKSVTVISDKTWQAADAPQWVPQTAKVSIQQEPQELYDARLEGAARFAPAAELCEARRGPWKDLHPRDVALLTKKPVSFKAFGGAAVVAPDRDVEFIIPTTRLMYPGAVEAGMSFASACAIATVLHLPKARALRVDAPQLRVFIDGVQAKDNAFTLAAGKHMLFAVVAHPLGHDKERFIRFLDTPSLKLTNPIDPKADSPWCLVPFDEFRLANDDMAFPWFGNKGPLGPYRQRYDECIPGWAAKAADLESFRAAYAAGAIVAGPETMHLRDAGLWQFQNRRQIEGALTRIDNPAACMHDTPEITTVYPTKAGDIELMYDLGEQDIGYFSLELIADEGVAVDIYALEYITPAGRRQTTWGNRNGMRYITRQGLNRFVSLKRRSGRYVFVTLRGLRSPVRIRKIELIESTYPVEYVGSFQCSDARLGDIWDISARTLKLCMEDTLTDCPLYEQTLWVGDARNESVFAYGTFGAVDLARRCIELAAQSLDRYPIVGCQLPSSWDCLLPAWSFLWGISVWDHYFYTGDAKWLARAWPRVMQNLRGARELTNDRGLFAGPFWNMFDWSGADQDHDIVLHNTMLAVGAVDAARRCAAVLGKAGDDAWLAEYRRLLCRGAECLWDGQKNAYRDSIHADGAISESTCQHTSFLAVLYDIAQGATAEHAKRNTLAPPAGMVRVGSPFAIMYLYEALEKLGRGDAILQSIYDSYLPMLEAGATTVWETFASSTYKPGDFPTRSHCHAWSSAPLHFLGRIVLGVRQAAAGGAEYAISPQPSGLTWAKGAVATVRGALGVSWRIDGKKLLVKTSAPAGVQVRLVPNDAMGDLELVAE